jgi:hypothetical protein
LTIRRLEAMVADVTRKVRVVAGLAILTALAGRTCMP